MKSFPRPTRAFYWALLWISCLTFIGNYYLKPYVNLNTSRIGKVITYLNSRFNEEDKNRKFVLICGSSRFYTAINIKHLTGIYHDKNVTFLNLSRPSMGPWHYSVVLRNTAMPLSRVKRVILEISPWMFNTNALHPTTKKSFQLRDELFKWGTIKERIELRDKYERMKALTIGLIPRVPLLHYITLFKKSDTAVDHVIPELEENQNSMKKIEANPNFRAENISKCHLHKFQVLQSETHKLAELVKTLDRAGIEVSLVHPPVRSEYYDYLDTNPRYRSEFEKYKNFVKGFSDKHQVIYWEKPLDCGLDNSIFVDYGHLSKKGSILFTRQLSVELSKVMN